MGILCVSAQSSLNGQTSSAGQWGMEVWHPVYCQFSDAEDESVCDYAFECRVGESGLFQTKLYTCAEVCDEFCVGITE